jgi:gephyrin
VITLLGTEEGQELEIKVLMKEVPPGDNVRQPGSDAKRGEQVLDKGTVIGSGGGEVGLLGFVGKREVRVSHVSRIAPLTKIHAKPRFWSTADRESQSCRPVMN